MQDAVVNFMRVRMLGQYITHTPVARAGNSVDLLNLSVYLRCPVVANRERARQPS